MVAITPVITKVSRGVYKVVWAALTESDTATAVTKKMGIPFFNDKSVQAEGSWGSGGTMQFHGSNDETVFTTLRDPGGTVISFTADDLIQVLENCSAVKPVLSAGTSVSIDVTLIVRGELPVF